MAKRRRTTAAAAAIVCAHAWRDAAAFVPGPSPTDISITSQLRPRKSHVATFTLLDREGARHEKGDNARATSSQLSSSSSSSNDNGNDNNEPSNAIEQEMERLQQRLTLIEAIEERNRAQLDSFVDEQDQWDSLEEEERQLLRSKVETEERLERLTSELVGLWMGGKSMEG